MKKAISHKVEEVEVQDNPEPKTKTKTIVRYMIIKMSETTNGVGAGLYLVKVSGKKPLEALLLERSDYSVLFNEREMPQIQALRFHQRLQILERKVNAMMSIAFPLDKDNDEIAKGITLNIVSN